LYTQYGECEQKLASGITESSETMRKALSSPDWKSLRQRLDKYVDNFSQKVISATGGFQL
jgi:hypothetical protein